MRIVLLWVCGLAIVLGGQRVALADPAADALAIAEMQAELANAAAELAEARGKQDRAQAGLAEMESEAGKRARGQAREGNWRDQQAKRLEIDRLEGQNPRNQGAINEAKGALEALIAADAQAHKRLSDAQWAVESGSGVGQAQAKIDEIKARIAARQAKPTVTPPRLETPKPTVRGPKAEEALEDILGVMLEAEMTRQQQERQRNKKAEPHSKDSKEQTMIDLPESGGGLRRVSPVLGAPVYEDTSVEFPTFRRSRHTRTHRSGWSSHKGSHRVSNIQRHSGRVHSSRAHTMRHTSTHRQFNASRSFSRSYSRRR